MEQSLPIIFVAIMGFSLLVYVILDGYDLGIGLLLPLATDAEKDIMVSTIGPFWDANETWIVLGIGILLIAFPEAHGKILGSLYIPVTIMLIGLILRGVAFDFRVKAGSKKKAMWNKAFFIGSFITATAQGWMLGYYITGLQGNLISLLFSGLIAIALPALYILLGSSWLIVKTENDIYNKAIRWGRAAIIPMAIGLILISIATPLVSEVIASRWFVLPNIIGLLPIPLFSMVSLISVYWLLTTKHSILEHFSWLPFACTALICLLAAMGLAYSIYPDIIIDQLTIFDAAADAKSLTFVLVGVIITLPMILGYTFFVYKVFAGKATDLSYD